MGKLIKNILCFDKFSFDQIMEDNKWFESLPKGISVISICSPREGEWSEHWFKKDHKNTKENPSFNRIFNLDIDDSHPFWFENHESDGYDNSLNLFNEGHIKQSNAYFNYCYVSGQNKEFFDIIHVLDYEEAFELVDWIDWRIKHDDIIYVHCAAGASRSQGVVRFICDTYKNDYDIKLNPYNPNNTYNPHVVLMLKRAYRELFMKDLDESYFETAPQKINSEIKINLL